MFLKFLSPWVSLKNFITAIPIFLVLTFLLTKLNVNLYLFYYLFNSQFSIFFKAVKPIDLIVIFFILYLLIVVNSYFVLSYLGLYGIFILNFIGVFLFWLSLCANFNLTFLFNESHTIVLFKWFVINNFYTVNFEFLVDSVSFSFAFLTTSIALFVNIYAFSYFRYEPNVDRLIIFLNSFVVSMVLLVLSGNLVMFFLGWELIGLTSFLLINFWSTRVGTLKSAFKAYSFNKYSDFLIFVSIILISICFNDFNIANILTNVDKYTSLYLSNIFSFHIYDIICFFFLIAAFIKSAQIGFHIWLPDSMEAPVPASALIHSATLVSAGIFMILRFYPIFENSYIFYFLTPLLSVITAFFGGLVAFYQNDLKRILAYSTISHCGFLMFLTTLGNIEFTLIYLYVHGFFKAIAFLAVGNLIRFSKNYQDIRRMGQLWKYLPFEFSIIFLALMNLSGLPFFFGFSIKHLIFISNDNFLWHKLIYAFLFIAAITGTFYFYKLVFYAFFDFKKARKSIYANNNQSFNSQYYSNSTYASLISIGMLTLVAYFFIFSLFKYFILDKSNFLFFNLSFYKIQNYYLFNTDLNLLFNYAFLNWVVVFCLVLLFYLRWSNSLDLFTSISRLYFLLYVFFFGYIYLF